MANVHDFKRMIRGSMRYEFYDTVLTITGWYSGKSISIDLGELTEEMFEELVVEEDDEDDDE